MDPNDHNTIYAGTGDLNYGSFSMGSQGILKSIDAGATWTVLGADVFGPAYDEPPGQFPQYNAVGKVQVDPNNSNNVVAGTKKGLYFSYDGGVNWTGPCTTNSFSTQRQDITGLELTDMGGGRYPHHRRSRRTRFRHTVQYDLGANGANGIYKGTMPISGCPSDFSLISRNDNGFVFGTQVTGSAYATGAPMNAGSGTPYAIASPSPAPCPLGISLGASKSLWRQAIRTTSMPKCSPSPSTATPAAAIPTAARSAFGPAPMAATAGRLWLDLPAVLSGTARRNHIGQPGDYPQNWYNQAVAVDPNNPDRVFISTFDVWFATRTGTSPLTIPPAAIPIAVVPVLCMWINTLSHFFLVPQASCCNR